MKIEEKNRNILAPCALNLDVFTSARCPFVEDLCAHHILVLEGLNVKSRISAKDHDCFQHGL